MADNQQDLIVALDVGTSKVAALIAQVSSDGLLEVIGVGKKASRGLKRGSTSTRPTSTAGVSRASWW